MRPSPDAKYRNEAGGAKRRRFRPTTVAAAGLLLAGLVAAALTQGPPKAAADPGASGFRSVPTAFGRAPLTFADLVEQVKPSVVSVHVKNGVKETKGPDIFKDLPDDHPLKEFFKKFGGQPNIPQRRMPTQAQGSGFIISSDGYVVTNNHVVGEASEISVTLDNGEKHDADLIGTDERTDIALLKIKDGGPFKVVKFASKEARVGDWVLAVGNPFGLGGTVTAGIVSARGRDIGSSPYDYLQIDAAVNKGNSGGPAFNLDGEVVGVNTAIWSPSGGNVGIAFAVPADLTRNVVAQLKEHGAVSRGWLGVTIRNVTEDLADSLGLEEAKGAMITKVTPNGPASMADLKVRDVIVQVGDKQIEDPRDLSRTIADLSPDSNEGITVYRDGAKQVINVKLGRFPGEKKIAKLNEGEPVGESMDQLGMSLAPSRGAPGSGEEGVVITDVDPDSKAAEKGLKSGDVIVEVAGVPVLKPDDVVQRVKQAKDKGRKAVDLLIRSGNRMHFVGLPLNKV